MEIDKRRDLSRLKWKNFRRPQRKTCPLCQHKFNEDSLGPQLIARLGLDQLDFCEPCITEAIFRLDRPDSTAEYILAWARDFSEALQRVPPQFFGEGMTDLLYLTTAERLVVLKLLHTRPSANSVAVTFGTWRNALIEAGVLAPRTRRRATRDRATPNLNTGTGEPSDAQLEALLTAIDEPPGPWADHWFAEKTATQGALPRTEDSEASRANSASGSERAASHDEALSQLGAALIEALREASEDPLSSSSVSPQNQNHPQVVKPEESDR